MIPFGVLIQQLLGGTPPAQPSTLLNGLVSWWTMDEESGDRLDSYSINHIAPNGTTSTAPGKLGNAGSLVKADASDFRVAGPNPFNLVSGRSFSFSGWFKLPVAPANYDGILASGTSSSASAHEYLLCFIDNKLRFYVPYLGTWYYADSDVVLATDTWYHFYVEYDADTNTIGVSANNETLHTAAGAASGTNTLASNFYLGAYPGYSTTTIQIDNVTAHHRVLTTEERDELYNSGAGLAFNTLGINSLKQQLVSWWTLSEASGTRADSHGGNDLEPSGTPVSVAGKVNNAVDLERDNGEYLYCNSPTGLWPDGAFTFCCWVKAETLLTDSMLMSYVNGTASFSNIGYYLRSSGVPNLYFGNGAGSVTLSLGENLELNGWNFLMYRWDGTTMEASINMGTVYQQAYTGAVNNPAGSVFRLGIDGGTSRYWDGSIDEAAFWGRALTDAEVEEVYNYGQGITYTDLATVPTLPTFTTDLRSWWTFNSDNTDEHGTLDLDNLLGTPAYSTGKFTNAVSLDGTNHVGKNSTNIIPYDQPNTIAGWFKVDSTGDYTIASYGIGTTAADGIYLQVRNLQASVYLYDGISYKGNNISAVTADTWYHFALVWEPDVGPFGRLLTYLNGAVELSVYSKALFGTGVAGEGADWLRFGRNFIATTNRPLVGDLDEIGLWDRALSNSEIVSLYNSGNGMAYADLTPSAIYDPVGDTFELTAYPGTEINPTGETITLTER